MRKILIAMFIIASGCAVACTSDSADSPENPSAQPPSNPSTPGSGGDDAGNDPDFDTTIQAYDGATASDADLDVVGDNADIYWEHSDNSFTNTVTVSYNGSAATVTTANDKVLYDISGAYVTLDLLTNLVKNVEVIVSGKSTDGGLKIYGDKKFKLTLNGVEITSTKGPAINSQCGKRAFVELAAGTTNRLTDAATYSDDTYYTEGASAATEDRKGCLFSEGNLIFSGTGVLVVAGKQKHAIVTDGYFWMRPGVTIAVTEAAKNAIHVKGDSDDGIGIYVGGGLIYANVASTAGKCLKSDLDIEIAGGKLDLNTSGGSEYDASENDTSSPAGIKSDANVVITGGEISIKSTGEGGKGINADGELQIDGGKVTAATSGGKYVYSSSLDSSPKAIKADGAITINGGEVNVSATGRNDGAEGLESKSTITINDGAVYCYAYDDAMNAATAITINGGRVYCYAVNNDGMDSNGTITITGGLVISSGTSSPEEGFDCDQNTFKITGGTVIGTGGATSTPTANVCTQRSVVYNGISATKDAMLVIRDASQKIILSYQLPRTINSMCLLFSSSELTASASYTLSTGGTLTGATSSWNGWMSGGTWSGGTQVGSFTSSSMVTTVGSSGGGGGGNRPW